MLLVIIAALLPAAGLLYFIWNKDKFRKEPTRELLRGFGYGMLSVPASLLLSMPLMLAGVYTMQPDTAGECISTALFGAGIPEEAAKFFLLVLFLRKNRYFDEYMDGIVYAVCIGLGFASLENIGYLFGNLSQWLGVGVLRGLLSVPAHFFLAVTMGYFYSLAVFGDSSKRRINLILAVAVPMLLHAAFDALLMMSGVGASIAASAVTLFLGLYIYLIVSSRKRIEKHLARDETFVGQGADDQSGSTEA